MAVDLTLKKVHMILSDVPPEKAFFISSGTYVRNLYELLDTLRFISDDVFGSHVSAEKNDFHPWLKDVVRDEVLAERLRKETDRARFIEAIESRIHELEAVEHTFEPQTADIDKTHAEIREAIQHVKHHGKSQHGFLLGFFLGMLIGLLLGYFLLKFL